MAHKGDSRKSARARIKVCDRFLEELLRDFEENGAGAIKLMRMEQPSRYCAMVASLLPREISMDIEHSQLEQMDDTEIDNLIERLRNSVRLSITTTVGAPESRSREEEKTRH